ncbi:hypothetical protein SBE55_17520 [Mycolicibacterium sp. 141076]|uniref:hypothetical protein n=1 Tax=Mycobacteriaceae TaxID=1762 RepID=UPI00299E8EF9|nr:hypothetical protein [Mycolicibacterium sp. 141076]MDX1879609.1 hypothetical protein [Mycolicibacterium sp. 141076]
MVDLDKFVMKAPDIERIVLIVVVEEQHVAVGEQGPAYSCGESVAPGLEASQADSVQANNCVSRSAVEDLATPYPSPRGSLGQYQPFGDAGELLWHRTPPRTVQIAKIGIEQMGEP